jgi:DNA-directed RNA polymerase specialized sigma24 family protein
MTDPATVTGWLEAASRGDREAFGRIFELVYGELRRLAHGALQREPAGHTLGTTALVHEAYLKLVDLTRGSSSPSIRVRRRTPR